MQNDKTERKNIVEDHVKNHVLRKPNTNNREGEKKTTWKKMIFFFIWHAVFSYNSLQKTKPTTTN